MTGPMRYNPCRVIHAVRGAGLADAFAHPLSRRITKTKATGSVVQCDADDNFTRTCDTIRGPLRAPDSSRRYIDRMLLAKHNCYFKGNGRSRRRPGLSITRARSAVCKHTRREKRIGRLPDATDEIAVFQSHYLLLSDVIRTIIDTRTRKYVSILFGESVSIALGLRTSR